MNGFTDEAEVLRLKQETAMQCDGVFFFFKPKESFHLKVSHSLYPDKPSVIQG